MALAERAVRRAPKGHAKPRLAPPTPARSEWKAVHAQAAEIGIELIPWQDTANRYLYALDPRGRWLYPEVAVLAGRQNGKTELLVPHIRRRLLMGRRITHTAQDRQLPREVYGRLADIMWKHHRDILRGKPRFANGQEEIRTVDGGIYRIVAPTRSGFRGLSNDDVILDEVRELNDHDVIAAGLPTLNASANPQVLYLSNAGDETSEVLNAIRKRAGEDSSLAYLEWSAPPELAPDALAGWLAANPAVGYLPGVLENLEAAYRRNLLGETMAIFDTENLCRWRVTTKPTLVPEGVWETARDNVGEPLNPYLGLALDESGGRASGVVAWQQRDGTYALRLVADVSGDPVDIDSFGPELREMAARLRVMRVVFGPYDEHLARHFRKPHPMNGREFVNACGTFARLLEGGRLHWQDSEAIGADLPWATKRMVGPAAWQAVKAKEERPITAVLAAIRAVGEVYASRTNTVARIY